VLRPLDVDHEPPEDLSPAAQAEWKRLARTDLGDRLADIDRNLLTIYARLWARWQEAEKRIDELGLVVKNPAGTPCVSPFLTISQATIAQLTQLGEKLGLSPAARGELRRRA
jgi:P27 family predicted phage terminase small subunit